MYVCACIRHEKLLQLSYALEDMFWYKYSEHDSKSFTLHRVSYDKHDFHSLSTYQLHFLPSTSQMNMITYSMLS